MKLHMGKRILTHFLIGLSFCIVVPLLAWCVVMSTRPVVDDNNAVKLRKIADDWADRRGTIPPSEWPAAIRRLQPRSVRVHEDGLMIERGSFFVQEWGWFILSANSEVQPDESGDPSFRLLQNRVYWYKIEG